MTIRRFVPWAGYRKPIFGGQGSPYREGERSKRRSRATRESRRADTNRFPNADDIFLSIGNIFHTQFTDDTLLVGSGVIVPIF